MACKKCDCEIQLQIQNIRHASEITELANHFLRLRRDMAWLEYKLTGDRKALEKLEFGKLHFKRKYGGIENE